MPFVLPAAAALATATYTGAVAAGAEPWVKYLLAGSGPLLLHAVLPAFDALAGERRLEPIPPAAKAPPTDSLPARLLPLLAVLAHLAVAAAAYSAVGSAPLQPALLALATISLAVSAAGSQAAAHELVHSRNGAHLAVAAAFLTLNWWYPYYRAHHQHHLHVCTPTDYTSAAKGENFYPYLLRYVAGNYAEAWELSAAECRKAGKPVFSSNNSTLIAYTAQALLTAGIALAFGPVAALTHAGVVAGLLVYMAAFDYVLHYGLTRPELPGSGGRRFAPVTPFTAWSSLFPVENALFFNVLYHGDHHMVGSKSYGWLRPAASAPAYPVPINLLALAVFVPPLWRAVMDTRADQVNSQNLEYLGLAAPAAQ